jgi:TPP-dependent pyruvate/acetoin dehydrogenase alpha subunit
MDRLALLRSMMLIRSFEAALVGRPDRGFQLLSSGAEAVAVGLCDALLDEDQLLCSGRSIAPALARGLDPGAVMAELLGRITGPNRGKAGRGHLALPSGGFFGAHAVVAGNLTIAAGVALALQQQRKARVAVCLFGDGACGSGALHETLNIAALWKLPLVLVCDNNQLAIATPRKQALAPVRLSDLAKPFGITGVTVDGMNVICVREAAADLVAKARAGHGPSLLECVSERFYSHSTATRETRSASDLAAARARCPILRLSGQLEADRVLNARALEDLQCEVDAEVVRAVAFAEASSLPDPAEALSDVV